MGPHCKSDGKSIEIGIYEDEDCAAYIGDMEEMEKYTEDDFGNNELSNYYDKGCISCLASEEYSLILDTNSGTDDSSAEIYTLCNVLYASSAKCNQYMADSQDTYSVSGVLLHLFLCAFRRIAVKP